MDGGGGDAVVFEVDEAGALEAGEEGGGGVEALGGRARGVLGEVDELGGGCEYAFVVRCGEFRLIFFFSILLFLDCSEVVMVI